MAILPRPVHEPGRLAAARRGGDLGRDARGADAIEIGAIVVINAIVGFLQEYRAERAVLALRSMTAPRARVMRDDQQTTVPATDVVPGDLLLLEARPWLPRRHELFAGSRWRIDGAASFGSLVGGDVPLPIGKRPQRDSNPCYRRERPVS